MTRREALRQIITLLEAAAEAAPVAGWPSVLGDPVRARQRPSTVSERRRPVTTTTRHPRSQLDRLATEAEITAATRNAPRYVTTPEQFARGFRRFGGGGAMTRDWARELTESTAALQAAMGIGRRGPWPGQGANAHAPWWGLCEETPQLWASWLADWWRRKTGEPLPQTPPFTLHHDATGEVELEGVRCTFGYRWYFRCPACWRRTEVLYQGRRGLACRRCNRLGHRSQAGRATAPVGLLWLDWGREFGRYWGDDRLLAELARELAEDVARKLDELFAGLRVEPADGGEEEPDGDDTT
jgi:hypothetical protein